jgi:hypothetical protein
MRPNHALDRLGSQVYSSLIMGVGSPRHDARLLMAAMAGALAAPMPMILLDGRDTDIGTL